MEGTREVCVVFASFLETTTIPEENACLCGRFRKTYGGDRKSIAYIAPWHDD